jgi:DNA-directed RNA polymerase specialized sigma subunit
MGAHHVKNKDLREAIILSKEKDELSADALNMLILMAEKFSNKLSYIYPEDKEDCISFAIMDCFQYWRGYNPEKSQNAFAYYTQIIKNGFAKGWRKLYGNMPKSSKISISQHTIYNL